MAAGSTYTPIATTTLGSAASSYTFSSIPSTYTDLIIEVVGLVTANTAGVTMQLNGDTGSNYSYTDLYGNGSVAGSVRGSSLAGANNYIGCPQLGWSSTDTNSMMIHVMNYSNATTYKTALARSASTRGTEATVNLWRSTAAVTSVTISAQSTINFASGTTFTLYGIAAA